ncbi:MAG: hypothetical protein ACE5F1_03655 [Planctomycetota bacterium]
MRHQLVLVAALLSSSHAVAQTCFYIPSNTPSTGTCNVIPFGTTKTSSTWKNQKYQTLLLKSQLKPTPGLICEIAFAPCGTGLRDFKSIEIVMDYFQGTGSTLSTTFANNISTQAKTVLKSSDYVWHVTRNQWNRIGLQKSFLYIPQRGHLVIQILVTEAGGQISGGGFHRTNNQQRVYAFGWSGSPPPSGGTDRAALKIEVCYDAADLGLFGQSCPGSNNLTPALALTGSAKLGNTVTVGLSGAPANGPVVFILGANSSAPYPITLVGSGPTACRLYESPDILVVHVANASGNATQLLPVGRTVPLCLRLYTQWAAIDATANSLGVTLTNYGRILTGN